MLKSGLIWRLKKRCKMLYKLRLKKWGGQVVVKGVNYYPKWNRILILSVPKLSPISLNGYPLLKIGSCLFFVAVLSLLMW